jgi:hypothetical protein
VPKSEGSDDGGETDGTREVEGTADHSEGKISGGTALLLTGVQPVLAESALTGVLERGDGDEGVPLIDSGGTIETISFSGCGGP